MVGKVKWGYAGVVLKNIRANTLWNSAVSIWFRCGSFIPFTWAWPAFPSRTLFLVLKLQELSAQRHTCLSPFPTGSQGPHALSLSQMYYFIVDSGAFCACSFICWELSSLPLPWILVPPLCVAKFTKPQVLASILLTQRNLFACT